MRLVGVTRAEDDCPWVAQTSMLDTPTAGEVMLVAPLRRFWADPDRALAEPDGSVLALGDGSVAVVPPVLPEARIICIGLNYDDHVAEGSFRDAERLPFPTLFGRWTRTLVAGGVATPVPPDEQGLDWEGEVAAWVGRDLSMADADQARDAIFGYSTFNDITARGAQKRTTQFMLGKNADRSGPIGPLVTVDEVGDLREGLRLQTSVNGVVVQDSSTSYQIHEAGETLAYISQTISLCAGDILCTGTPAGVGYARDPQWLLDDGDVVEVTVERLGTLRTPIIR